MNILFFYGTFRMVSFSLKVTLIKISFLIISLWKVVFNLSLERFISVNGLGILPFTFEFSLARRTSRYPVQSRPCRWGGSAPSFTPSPVTSHLKPSKKINEDLDSEQRIDGGNRWLIMRNIEDNVVLNRGKV